MIRIKLLHIISSNEIGGAERMLQKILDHNKAKDHKSYMLCLDKPGALTPIYQKKVEKIWFLPKSKTFSLEVFRILREIKKIKPDVTMGWMYRGMLVAWLVKKRLQTTRLIWTVRKSLTNIRDEKFSTRLIIRLLSKISNLAEATIYNSKDAIAKHAELGFNREKAVFIPNGFDKTKFYPGAKDQELANSLKLDLMKPIVSIVARFHPCKGHKLIVDAAMHLKKEGLYCQFLLVGKGFETMPVVLKEKIESYGVEDYFFTLAAVSETGKIYNLSDAVVSSSYVEGFSNTIGEALFSNTPVFVSDAGDSEYIVGDQQYVFPKGNALELSKKLAIWLKLSPTEREIFQDEAFERAKRLFSIEEVGESYYSVMEGA